MRLSETRKREIRYGALALAVLLLAAGAILLSHHSDLPTEPKDASSPPPTAPSARRATGPAAPATTDTATSQALDSDDIQGVSSLRRDEAVALIAEARRHAASGDYAAAEASLERAESALPNLPETAEARRDIERLKTPEGQLDAQLQRARLAIEHDDAATAEAALAEAARLKPDAPPIAALQAALQAAHDRKMKREAHVAEALARMREAVARRDFGAADSALNEAERIDLQDPAVRQARGELARARSAGANVSD